MIPQPIRYRARRLPEGPPAVEFQQALGDRWFPLAPVALNIPFGWGPEAKGEEVRHLAGALLVSRVSLGEANELIEDFAALVARMPPQGWEMDGQTLGTVIARLVCGKPVPDGSRPTIDEQRLAVLFGAKPELMGSCADCRQPIQIIRETAVGPLLTGDGLCSRCRTARNLRTAAPHG